MKTQIPFAENFVTNEKENYCSFGSDNDIGDVYAGKCSRDWFIERQQY